MNAGNTLHNVKDVVKKQMTPFATGGAFSFELTPSDDVFGGFKKPKWRARVKVIRQRLADDNGYHGLALSNQEADAHYSKTLTDFSIYVANKINNAG
jgi:hypothetical protein